MPEVAFVEFPPGMLKRHFERGGTEEGILVEDEDVSACLKHTVSRT
jgi:hypothetical protein